MFSFKVKAALALYVFLILCIPVGAYLASQNESKDTKTSAKEEAKPLTPITEPITKLPESTSSATKTVSLLDEITNLSNPTPESSTSSTPTTATSFGPTLNLVLSLEGRPTTQQASKVFVGITEASAGTNPQYLLSFTIDLPDSGIYEGVSLAGLNTGSQYAAVIKPTAQIAKTVKFTMLPSETELNNGAAITLNTGDLNEDNVINSADYAISKALLGTTPKSANWTAIADFNLDGIVNIIDLSYIIKNFSESGDSGVWVSPTPSTATASGSLSPTAAMLPASSSGVIKHPTGSSDGYWIWVPKEVGQ